MRRRLPFVVTLTTLALAAVSAGAETMLAAPIVSRFTAGEACGVFNDQAEFEAAMENSGLGLMGVEGFYGAFMPPDAAYVFDDPLCGGIPSAPDGFPFQTGLEQLNLCVQSNFEHNPGTPGPRGVDGLVALSPAFLGVLSTIVLPVEFVDSLDLMFSEPNPTAVGFNPISLLGGDEVKVHVYDTSNTLLATATSPADAPGQIFWGVLCPEAIGRINIFDTDNGVEGGDFISMWVAPVCGDGECVAESCDTCPEDCVACINDDCEDSIPIFDGETDFSTIGATTDGANHGFCQYGQTHDIWYDYTATCTGALTVATCGAADYDTDIVIYSGCEMPCPPGTGHLWGCSDNALGCSSGSMLVVAVTEGSCYKIRVGGEYDNDQGTGTLSLTCAPNLPGDMVFFMDQAEFEVFADGQGVVLNGVETFEEAILPPSSVALADQPLQPGVPNQPDTGFPFPNGLEGVANIIYQLNLDGGNPDDPNPGPNSENALTVRSAGFQGAPSDGVVSTPLGASTDVIFTHDGISAVGFTTMSYILDGAAVEIRIFDRDDVLRAVGYAPTNSFGSYFFGVWSPLSIGRINVWDPQGGQEGFDNIQIWVSVDLLCGDCPTDVDGSGNTGAADLAFLLGLWGPCAPGEACTCLDADGHGTIGAEDLAALLGAWGPCP